MARSTPQEALEELGLSRYAADTLIGLQKVSPATASDIASVTDVPRSQVYGAIEELEELGLVHTQSTNPKEFVAVPPETIGEILQAQVNQQAETAVTHLQELQSTTAVDDFDSEQIWRTQGIASITQRLIQLLDEADTHVRYFSTASTPLSPELEGAFETVTEQDVTVSLYTAAEDPRNLEALEKKDSAVSVTQVAALPPATDQCTRILVVDQKAALVGVATGVESAKEICFWSTSEQIAPVLAVSLQGLLENLAAKAN